MSIRLCTLSFCAILNNHTNRPLGVHIGLNFCCLNAAQHATGDRLLKKHGIVSNCHPTTAQKFLGWVHNQVREALSAMVDTKKNTSFLVSVVENFSSSARTYLFTTAPHSSSLLPLLILLSSLQSSALLGTWSPASAPRRNVLHCVTSTVIGTFGDVEPCLCTTTEMCCIA